MDKLLFQNFWFLLPAGIANMVPIIVAHMPIVKSFTFPLDFGYSFKGCRVFGKNKTIRGILFGTAAGMITAWMQQYYYRFLPIEYKLMLVDIMIYSPIIYGASLGFASLLADAIASFFKRQKRIAPGSSWKIVDQLDYIIGALVALSFFVKIDPQFIVMSIGVWGIAHLVVSYLGYVFGLKKQAI